MKVTIKAARVNAGLTQNKASELLKIPRGKLIRLEADASEITYATLLNMSRIYGCRIDDFILSENLTKC